MKKIVLIISVAASLGLAGCSNAPQSAQTVNSNTAIVTNSNNALLVASSRSAQGTNPSANNAAKPAENSPTATGQARAIDTSGFDAEIAKAEKEYKQKSKDETAQKNLAEAYAARGFALTEAAQYRAALGDLRKCLKLDPTNKEAQQMHDQIVSIFKSLNREPPKEGEEPAPLPFKKEA